MSKVKTVKLNFNPKKNIKDGLACLFRTPADDKEQITECYTTDIKKDKKEYSYPPFSKGEIIIGFYCKL